MPKIHCHGVVGARGYISRRNCFSRLLGFPSARVACVAAEVTRGLGRNFPVHVSRVVLGTGTRVPVSIPVTRVPGRYPGTRVSLNTRVIFFTKLGTLYF